MIGHIALDLAIDGWRGPSQNLYGPGHALLLDLVRTADPGTAQSIHDANQQKPFALSPLRVESLGNGVARASLSINVWDDSLAHLLHRSLQDALSLRPRVGRAPASILSITAANPVPLCDLPPNPVPQTVNVKFISPTCFSLGRGPTGKQMYGVLPDPALTVSSWLRRWLQAGGHFPGPGQMHGWLAPRVAVRSVRDLSTVTVSGQKTALTGFTGSVSYAWTGDEEWGPSLLATLARFAQYCGTGAKTGHGMGQTVCAGGQSHHGR